MTTGAKIGLGVGIPIAVALGILAGWFFFGRRKQKHELAAELPTQTGKSGSNTMYQQPVMVEAPNTERYSRPSELPYSPRH